MKTIILMLAAASTLSACAEKSANIAPSYTPASRFSSMDCSQLSYEGQQMNRTLASMSAAQDKQASNDAAMVGVGLILFWPALVAPMVSGDNATQIAQLKGDAQAMDTAYRMKGCGLKA